MVQLTIRVTKEILERAKWCNDIGTGETCAVAYAVRDLWPKAWVKLYEISPFGLGEGGAIELPNPVRDFIRRFDNTHPEDRPNLPELEFTVNIPDAVIDRINIDEIRPLLVNHPTLTLIEA